MSCNTALHKAYIKQKTISRQVPVANLTTEKDKISLSGEVWQIHNFYSTW